MLSATSLFQYFVRGVPTFRARDDDDGLFVASIHFSWLPLPPEVLVQPARLRMRVISS
jgi:hypothetical protein